MATTPAPASGPLIVISPLQVTGYFGKYSELCQIMNGCGKLICVK
ncbi:hypothetical protein J2128_000364 [Methanomicrobium sp. W14]|nr:hypothetical protein [Methanomicrobium sp. W14]MBP2132443.1 hypothetical protein [Methanomicrobium sp. W14]